MIINRKLEEFFEKDDFVFSAIFFGGMIYFGYKGDYSTAWSFFLTGFFSLKSFFATIRFHQCRNDLEELLRSKFQFDEEVFMEKQLMYNRHGNPTERLDNMFAFRGVCRHCNGVVMMMRDMKTGNLMPKHCFCMMCGQRYEMEIANIEQFDLEQWDQKRNALK